MPHAPEEFTARGNGVHFGIVKFDFADFNWMVDRHALELESSRGGCTLSFAVVIKLTACVIHSFMNE